MNRMLIITAIEICLLSAARYGSAFKGNEECPSNSDGVKTYLWYNTTVDCTEETRGPTGDCRWPSGMNARVDEIAYGGRIIVYKLQWFNGIWSPWYVPGMNDMDCKFNPSSYNYCSLPYPANGLRKAWSYFYDHTHTIIICK